MNTVPAAPPLHSLIHQRDWPGGSRHSAPTCVMLVAITLILGASVQVSAARPLGADVTAMPSLAAQVAAEEICAMAIDGDNVYLAARSQLIIVDVSDPRRPRERCAAGWPPGSPADVQATGMVVADDRLYRSDAAGLWLFDVRQPCEPRLLHELPIAGAKAVAVQDDLAYVITDDTVTAIAVVDGTKLEAGSVFRSTGPLGGRFGTFEDIAVSGPFAYLANGAKGICRLGYSTTGGFTGDCETESRDSRGYLDVPVPNYTRAVTYAGGLAYTADGAGDSAGGLMRIVRFEGDEWPWTGQVVGEYQAGRAELSSTGDIALGRAGQELTAFLRDVRDERVTLVDVSDRSGPVRRPHPIVPARRLTLAIRDMEAKGSFAYVLASDEQRAVLAIADVSEPRREIEPRRIRRPGSVRRIAVADEYAYATDREGGLIVLDVTEPGAPRVGLSMEPKADDGDALDVTVFGTRAYVADGNGGVAVFDVSNPESPSQIVDALPNLGTADVAGVDAADGLLCAAKSEAIGGRNLAVYDIDGSRFDGWLDVVTSAAPSDCAVVRATDGAPYVAAYVFTIEEGLFSVYKLWTVSTVLGRVYELTTMPGQPVASGGKPYSAVRVFGDRAYVTNGDSGLSVFDIRRPSEGVAKIAEVGTNGSAEDVFVDGQIAYVVNSDKGVAVVDLATSGVVGMQPFGAGVGIAGRGDHLYIAGGASGLKVLSLTGAQSPTAPPPVTMLPAASSTPEPSQTPTAVDPTSTSPGQVATATSTPTATRRAGPAFLPLLQRSRWRPSPTPTPAPTATPTPTATSVPCLGDLEQEPNGSPLELAEHQQPRLCPDMPVRGRLDTAGDVLDLYWFQLDMTYAVTVLLADIPDNVGIGLAVYDSLGTIRGQNSAARDHQLSITVDLPADRYYIGVYAFKDDPRRSEKYYRLRWDGRIP